MADHLHARICFEKTEKTINKIIGDGKRCMAYEIVEWLKEKGTNLLLTLLNAVENKDR